MGRLKGQLVAQVGEIDGEDRPWVFGFSREGEVPSPDRFVHFTHGELQAVARLMVCVAALDLPRLGMASPFEAALFGDAWYVGDRKIA